MRGGETGDAKEVARAEKAMNGSAVPAKSKEESFMIPFRRLLWGDVMIRNTRASEWFHFVAGQPSEENWENKA